MSVKVSSGSPSERYGFIQRFRSQLGTAYLCRWLSVSRSGFYAWLKRQPSIRHLEDRDLAYEIKRIFEESEERYGSPRVHQALRNKGINVGKKRVARLMQELKLKARVSRVTRIAPGRKLFVSQGRNRLLEQGETTHINQVWVADVTYLKVKGKWQYLATVMDQHSRKILGWSLAGTRTTKLTSNALKYALRKRDHPKNLILHTDRGIEFIGFDFQKVLKKNRIKHSLNRPGHCTDNAFMESFFHTLKGELIRGTFFHTARELRRAISHYINQFYNRKRLHSGLNYQSPVNYEASLV